MSWANRIRYPSGTPPMHQVQAAAENLADQAGIAPGKTRVVFGTVTDVAILTAAITGAALGAVHLWRTLFPKHKENPHDPEPAGNDRFPPRRHVTFTTSLAGDPQGRSHDDGARSR